MYAIFESGGKQYKVQEGDQVFLEKLVAEEDATITIDKVLCVGKDSGAVFGDPLVKGATITAKVLRQGKGKKLTVFTYKPKKNQKRKLGHRQPYTKVEIVSIAG